MITAGIKKELLMFVRCHKLLGIIILLVAISGAYPLLYKFMEVMMEQMKELGGPAEIGEAVDSMTSAIDSLTALYGGSLANAGFYTAVMGFTNEGFLVIALLLMSTAGGEQKKRSVIMPNCAGLTPAGYVMPKYIIYPILSFITVLLGTLITMGITNVMYNTSLNINDVLISGFSAAVYVMFMISLYMLIGLATGRPGISVIIMYLGTALVSLLLQSVNIDKYNPFALLNMIMVSYNYADMNNFALSIAVSVILSVICCVLTLMVCSLKRFSNTEGEANL